MSDISFNCPECEGHLIVDEAGAGRDVPCPHCGQTLHIPDASAARETPALQVDKHIEQHGSDINIDQPWQKKHDQWFTADGKHYHYCYYNPHADGMATACGDTMSVHDGSPAPADLSKLKRRAFCKKCRAALE